ncbi:MAG: DUF5996 family protein [Chloroflexota bacterium]|nr:DUF5996 family protein [Chloroflexota bacterium]
MSEARGSWPSLPLEDWQDTYATLHMYTQIVGKIRLALSPMTNHWWQVPLYVTARGLTTSPMAYHDRTFQMDFDLFDHQLLVQTCDGDVRRVALGPAVKDFYREVLATLQALGIRPRIWRRPVEVPDPIPFDEDDRHATYDPAAAQRFWQVLRRVERVFHEFRGRFTGKSSPVHFFWGSFDLAVTRFSGRPAAPKPGADLITRVAYNAEQSSLGFWPGGGEVRGAAFYSYTYPQPAGFERQPARPEGAFYHAGLGEFLLLYEDVYAAEDPARLILEFAQSTYEAGARLQGWPIDELELPPVGGEVSGPVSQVAAAKAPNPSVP